MKILIAADKFKGSLTSYEACNAIATGMRFAAKDAHVLQFPMADGGDGFAAVLGNYLQTTTVSCNTFDPLGRPMKGFYQWNEKDKTAIIETAVASGLVLLKEEERNPLQTSTWGTGCLVAHAIENGATTIILGLGGSATNDGGMGILAALGFQFKDADDYKLAPIGKNLSRIFKIIPPEQLPGVHFQLACDVKNILTGPNGAAYIYGPQKGATPEVFIELDEGLQHFASIIKDQTGKDVVNIEGSGAAGGIAAGMMAYLNVTIIRGIELVIKASGIENILPGTDIIVTGEGKIDEQSQEGKVVGRIAAMAKEKNIPVIALCGSLALNEKEWKALGLTAVSSIMNEPITLETAMKDAAELLKKKARIIIQSFL